MATAFAAARRCEDRRAGYPAVIIPVIAPHYPMLQRNPLYTGLTRGKRLVSSSARRRPS